MVVPIFAPRGRRKPEGGGWRGAVAMKEMRGEGEGEENGWTGRCRPWCPFAARGSHPLLLSKCGKERASERKVWELRESPLADPFVNEQACERKEKKNGEGESRFSPTLHSTFADARSLFASPRAPRTPAPRAVHTSSLPTTAPKRKATARASKATPPKKPATTTRSTRGGGGAAAAAPAIPQASYDPDDTKPPPEVAAAMAARLPIDLEAGWGYMEVRRERREGRRDLLFIGRPAREGARRAGAALRPLGSGPRIPRHTTRIHRGHGCTRSSCTGCESAAQSDGPRAARALLRESVVFFGRRKKGRRTEKRKSPPALLLTHAPQHPTITLGRPPRTPCGAWGGRRGGGRAGSGRGEEASVSAPRAHTTPTRSLPCTARLHQAEADHGERERSPVRGRALQESVHVSDEREEREGRGAGGRSLNPRPTFFFLLSSSRPAPPLLFPS